MTEALVAFAVLLVAALVGTLLKPTPEQSRPLFPEVAVNKGSEPDSHHSH